MGDVIQRPVSGLPAELSSIFGEQAAYDEFAGGVSSGFPVISYRGRTWRVKQGGEEQIALNEDGDALQAIEVVLIKSNENPSKTFYEAKYAEGDQGPPRCWSANGVRPDANVQQPIAATCAVCPNNVWGSKITENNKKTRACQDVRRVAVMFMHDLEALASGEKERADCPVLLLRIPPATLNPLKDYATAVLKPKGIPPYAVITRIGFDTEVSYPKLTFKAKRFVNGPEGALIMSLREDEAVLRILNESAEHDAAGTTESQSPVGGEVPAPQAAAKAPAASLKKTAVEEEELNFDAPVAPAPQPAKRAAQVETASAEVEEIEEEIAAAPPPTPKPAAKKKAAPAKPATVEAPPTPVAAADADFDSMLDAILLS
jgi:hypothetical protein